VKNNFDTAGQAIKAVSHCFNLMQPQDTQIQHTKRLTLVMEFKKMPPWMQELL
jgi:hypothetical protein